MDKWEKGEGSPFILAEEQHIAYTDKHIHYKHHNWQLHTNLLKLSIIKLTFTRKERAFTKYLFNESFSY